MRRCKHVEVIMVTRYEYYRSIANHSVTTSGPLSLLMMMPSNTKLPLHIPYSLRRHMCTLPPLQINKQTGRHLQLTVTCTGRHPPVAACRGGAGVREESYTQKQKGSPGPWFRQSWLCREHLTKRRTVHSKISSTFRWKACCSSCSVLYGSAHLQSAPS